MTPFAQAGGLERIAGLIHLAVAPIFLLTAVAGTLTVFAGRLSRIVDRGRFLERAQSGGREELLALQKRARLIYWALSLGVFAAILVSSLMSVVFAGAVFQFEAARMVAALFMTALFAYTAALLCLLREVFLALGSFRLGLSAVAPGKAD